MATVTQSPDQYLVTELGKLHPDYTIMLHTPVNEVYPYIRVTNGKVETSIQIRLAKNYWSVSVIDTVVVKAIKRIEKLSTKARTLIQKDKS